MAEFIVELLTTDHDRTKFDCGNAALTAWLRTTARQAQDLGSARVYIARDLGSPRVLGYYALCAASALQGNVPKSVAERTGRHDIPAVLLARLAVDTELQGAGLGRALLVDTLRQTAATAELIGVRMLLIHCEDETAKRFYLAHAAFEESPTDALHLILPLQDLRRALGGG